MLLFYHFSKLNHVGSDSTKLSPASDTVITKHHHIIKNYSILKCICSNCVFFYFFAFIDYQRTIVNMCKSVSQNNEQKHLESVKV